MAAPSCSHRRKSLSHQHRKSLKSHLKKIFHQWMQPHMVIRYRFLIVMCLIPQWHRWNLMWQLLLQSTLMLTMCLSLYPANCQWHTEITWLLWRMQASLDQTQRSRGFGTKKWWEGWLHRWLGVLSALQNAHWKPRWRSWRWMTAEGTVWMLSLHPQFSIKLRIELKR